MDQERVILNRERLGLTIERMCHQLIEQFDQFDDACLIGVQPRGVPFSDRIFRRLSTLLDKPDLHYGKLDITFYRDDFRLRNKPLVPGTTQLDFSIEDRNVILVDDVLYTGRTIQAALAALNDYGRPRAVELAVLVDRRFNRHLPIQADFIGITVDALDQAYVQVEWEPDLPDGKVVLFADKKDRDR